jgi:hypothetical protein
MLLGRGFLASPDRECKDQSGGAGAGSLRQADAAARFLISNSLYQKLESRDRKPQHDFAAMCDELFGTPGVFSCLYQDMITDPYPAWFGPRVAYEDKAAAITDWEQRGIPGMLQTEDYAAAPHRNCELSSRKACSGNASAVGTSWPSS